MDRQVELCCAYQGELPHQFRAELSDLFHDGFKVEIGGWEGQVAFLIQNKMLHIQYTFDEHQKVEWNSHVVARLSAMAC